MAPRSTMGWTLALLLVALLQISSAFYLPGSYLHAYPPGTDLWVKVNSLTSIETELPYGYYTLPFCKPEGGVKKSAENLGELLMGDEIENTPYKFRMSQSESDVYLCTKVLTDNDVKNIKQRIDDIYQVNLMLDNLPAMRLTVSPETNVINHWHGYLVGFRARNDDSYYIFNHLKFKVLIHKYEDTGVGSVMGTGDGFDAIQTSGDGNVSGYVVVGFEVAPCSYPHKEATKSLKMYDHVSPKIECSLDSGRWQKVDAGASLSFTYEVEFEESPIRWPSRWDAYLQMDAGSRVHWFSIVNSLMVIGFLAGIVFVIFLRTIRRDLTKYEELDKEAQEELSGWKLVVGDVFRAPPHPKLLCVMIGGGVQILGMAAVTILFAAFGFMSPASRGMLLTGMVLVYLFLGTTAGYAASKLHKTLRQGDATGWRSIAWGTAAFFPGIAFTILTILNFVLWANHSTGAIPISTFFVLLALWFCISVPLTLLGGYFGVRGEHIHYPVRTNQIPREIPPQKYPSWALILGAGTLPFGTLYVELFFILSSIWMGRFYYVFGFLFIVLMMVVIICAEVSVVLTYMHLCVEDYRWWWRAFYSSGSVALYVFLYALNYLIFDLHSLSGPVSAFLYMGYTVLVSFALMLATGTIGFLSSFFFTHYLFASVKLD